MGTHRYEAPVDLPAGELFEYLRDIRNLPEYLPEMTELTPEGSDPEGGEKVHVQAEIHGRTVDGEAWLRVDEANRRLSWGAPGLDDYHGELEIKDNGPGTCTVQIELHAERANDAEVRQGLERTVAVLSQSALAHADTEDSGQAWH